LLQAEYHHVKRAIVAAYVNDCRTCAARRQIRWAPAGQPIYAKGPMELMAIDLIDMTGRPDDIYKYILHVSENLVEPSRHLDQTKHCT